MSPDMAPRPFVPRESHALTNANHNGDNEALWERTRRAQERLPASPQNDGLFKGREIIHRDSRIAGGVCLGANGREAVVVDWRQKASPGTTTCLDALYTIAVERATLDGRFRRSRALQAVYETIDEHFIDRTPSAVERVNHRVGAGTDDKVHIDCYIAARTGVCRHMALACAAILERMVDEGLLRGKVSHDRNSIAGQGAHAWCRYTSSNGSIAILDAMQRFFGTLEKSKEVGMWDYSRPEERASAA